MNNFQGGGDSLFRHMLSGRFMSGNDRPTPQNVPAPKDGGGNGGGGTGTKPKEQDDPYPGRRR